MLGSQVYVTVSGLVNVFRKFGSNILGMIVNACPYLAFGVFLSQRAVFETT